MSITVREPLKAIPSYMPARSLHSIEEELGLSRILKLAANENSLGCSPHVAEAIAESVGLFARYPDYANSELLKRLTVKHGIEDDNLIFTNGSFEMISIIGETYLNPGDEVIVLDPTFGWYENVSKQAGAVTVKVPVTKDGAADVKGILEAVTDQTKVIWLCNPNNPTGGMVDQPEIEYLLDNLREDILLVLDEAYIDFAESQRHVDSVELIHKYSNIVSLHTFSKLYGLASFRMAYAYAPVEIIRQLYTVKQPFNINFAGQLAAAASLDDQEFPARVKEMITKGRQQYYDVLDSLGLDYIRSNGNFILFETGIPAEEAVQAYLKKGILLRGGNEFGRPTWLRVSIGTEEENQAALDLLKELVAEKRR